MNNYKKRRRGYKSIFIKKKNPLPKILMWIFIVLLLVGVGFGLTTLIYHVSTNSGDEISQPYDGEESNQDESTIEESPTSEESSIDSVTADASDLSNMKAIYVAPEKLISEADIDKAISTCTDAGLNTIVTTIKSDNGELTFATSLDGMDEAKGSVQLDIRALKEKLQASNLKLAVEMSCFKDPIANKINRDACIKLAGNSSYIWLDNSLEKGGKSWLSPYSTAAHEYLTAIAKDAVTQGADTVILTDIMMPGNKSQADFGSQASGKEPADAFKTFVKYATEEIEKAGGNTILSMTGKSTIDVETERYGGNPLTFEAKAVAPRFIMKDMPNKITIGTVAITNDSADSATIMKTLAGNVKSIAPDATLVPYIDADINKDTIKEELSGLTDAGVNAFILYSSKGVYSSDIVH